MSANGLTYMLLFYFFSAVFFVIAIVVIWFGFRDLKDLLAGIKKEQ